MVEIQFHSCENFFHSYEKHFHINELPFHLSEQQFHFHATRFHSNEFHFQSQFQILPSAYNSLSVNRKMPKFLLRKNTYNCTIPRPTQVGAISKVQK